jgi:hypothetical protein
VILARRTAFLMGRSPSDACPHALQRSMTGCGCTTGPDTMASEISDFWTDIHDDGRSLLELVALKANDGIWGWDVPTGQSFYSARWWIWWIAARSSRSAYRRVFRPAPPRRPRECARGACRIHL